LCYLNWYRSLPQSSPPCKLKSRTRRKPLRRRNYSKRRSHSLVSRGDANHGPFHLQLDSALLVSSGAILPMYVAPRPLSAILAQAPIYPPTTGLNSPNVYVDHDCAHYEICCANCHDQHDASSTSCPFFKARSSPGQLQKLQKARVDRLRRLL
jgi:hypothetical protein